MRNILLSILVMASLTACWNRDDIVRPDVREVPVPVAYVPKPPDVKRPILATETLSEEDKKNVGVLVKAHRVALQQTLSYAEILENIVNVYRNLHIETKANIDSLKTPIVFGVNATPNTVIELPNFSDPVTHYENLFDSIQKHASEQEALNYIGNINE